MVPYLQIENETSNKTKAFKDGSTKVERLAGKSRDRTDKNHKEKWKTGYDFAMTGKRLIYAKTTCIAGLSLFTFTSNTVRCQSFKPTVYPEN